MKEDKVSSQILHVQISNILWAQKTFLVLFWIGMPSRSLKVYLKKKKNQIHSGKIWSWNLEIWVRKTWLYVAIDCGKLLNSWLDRCVQSNSKHTYHAFTKLGAEFVGVSVQTMNIVGSCLNPTWLYPLWTRVPYKYNYHLVPWF